MTKAKLHETIVALCVEHKVSAKFTEAISELTKPKVGGSSDVNDYTCFDTDGAPEFVFCTYHKQWEPVVAEDEDGEEFNLFVADAKSKNGLRRFCDMGDKQWKEAAKIFNASKTAILADVLDEKLTGSEGKAAIAELQTARDVHAERTDGLGENDKPCGEAEAE